jgi:hypothetical protein
MGQKIGLWQPYRDEEYKRWKWSYWDLWQARPFMTTKQTTPCAVNYRLNAHWTRWIQTELAFTLAKNATKPNPFEIIILQTIRKENNWETEETLVRAVVCNSGDGTDQRVQSLMFMMMTMIFCGSFADYFPYKNFNFKYPKIYAVVTGCWIKHFKRLRPLDQSLRTDNVKKDAQPK